MCWHARRKWVDEQAEKSAQEAEQGKLDNVWGRVRGLLGRNWRSSIETCRLTDQNNVLATTVEHRAQIWREVFLEEFWGCGQTRQREDVLEVLKQRLQVVESVPLCNNTKGLPQSETDWADALEQQVHRIKPRKASGPDGVMGELVVAAGRPLLEILASLVSGAVDGSIPTSWGGGRMACVPRNARLPAGRDNARGILCANITSKLLSGVLRQGALPILARAARDRQFGAIPKGGIEPPRFVREAFLRMSKAMGLSAAVIFVDLRKAFYSVLLEQAVGPLYHQEARQQLLARLGMSSVDIGEFEKDIDQGGYEMAKLGVPGDVAKLIAKVSCAHWFQVSDAAEVVEVQRVFVPWPPLVGPPVHVCLPPLP
jgi:hypothetical protein